MRSFTIDYMGFIFWPLAIWCGATGRIDAWVLVLFVLHSIEIKHKLARRS